MISAQPEDVRSFRSGHARKLSRSGKPFNHNSEHQTTDEFLLPFRNALDNVIAMIRAIKYALLTIGLLGLSACSQPSADSGPKKAGPVQPVAQAQSKLPTIKLWTGTNEITAEIARTSKQHQMGMMYRTNMGELEGMVFIFDYPSQRSFWMKNTTVPLDIAYITPEGIIQEIHPLHPLNENAVYSQSHNIQFVLEMNQNWFSNHNVKAGMEIRTEKGGFMETFLRR